jgi:hypothetical protein
LVDGKVLFLGNSQQRSNSVNRRPFYKFVAGLLFRKKKAVAIRTNKLGKSLCKIYMLKRLTVKINGGTKTEFYRHRSRVKINVLIHFNML